MLFPIYDIHLRSSDERQPTRWKVSAFRLDRYAVKRNSQRVGNTLWPFSEVSKCCPQLGCMTQTASEGRFVLCEQIFRTGCNGSSLFCDYDVPWDEHCAIFVALLNPKWDSRTRRKQRKNVTICHVADLEHVSAGSSCCMLATNTVSCDRKL